MIASSAGSTLLFALGLFVISICVLLLVRYYIPLRSTPAYLSVPVFLAIALPASIILLVPIDLASSAGIDAEDQRGIWLSERLIQVSWRILYWLTFVLTWAILPLLGEYCDAGYREPKGKMLYSLKSNGQFYAIMFGIGAISAVYFFLQNGFHFSSLKGLVMALAYAWGLILAICLMGHGLVAIPRRFLRHASLPDRLKRQQSQAPRLHERLTESIGALERYEHQVFLLKQRKSAISREFQEWIEELYEKSDLPESRLPGTPHSGSASIPAVITENFLADLTRKIKRARHAKMRFADAWNRLVRSAVRTQAILDSSASRSLIFPMSSSDESTRLFSQYTLLTPYTRYLLHAHVLPYFYYLLSFILSLASVAITWSEVIKPVNVKLSLIRMTVVHHQSDSVGQIGFAGQSLAVLWLLYMCTAALYAVTEVKIWGNRALVRRCTYQESAAWYACQVAKLTVPLAYNFTTLTPPSLEYAKEGKDGVTVFHRFFGQFIVLTPLGQGFETFFPILLLVPAAATLFNLYSKAKRVCGFGEYFEDDDEDSATKFGSGSWREGRALIEREVQDLTTGPLPGSTSNVGLSHRPSSPLPSRYRDDPATDSAAASNQNSLLDNSSRRVGTSASNTRSATPLPAPRRYQDIEDAENEDPGFFSDFALRFRNKIDDLDIPKPKWLQGNDSSAVAGSSRSRRDDSAAIQGDDAPNRDWFGLGLFGGGSGSGGRGNRGRNAVDDTSIGNFLGGGERSRDREGFLRL